MLSFSQLEFSLAPSVVEKPPGRDSALEALARDLLLQQGATTLAAQVRVEWSARLRTAAGRAECGAARILLNRRLAAHGEAEIDRTFAMSWRTCSRNFAPAAVASRPMGWNGGGPAPIWGLAAKRAATICPSLFGASGAVISTPAPIASATFHAPARCGAPPPASPVAGPSIAVAMTAASSSGSSGVRRGVAFR